MTDWRQELVGKFVWHHQLGIAGVVAAAHGPGEYVDAQGRNVADPVVEFEDGSSAVASDDRQHLFRPMSRNAAMLHELSTKVVADAVELLAKHAAAYGLDVRLSALAISNVVARQGRLLRAVADKRDPPGSPDEIVPLKAEST
jgi:hypothetical protein